MKIQKPTGTQDILPSDVEKWQLMENKARELCRRYHYKEIRTPIFEHTELFVRGVGETTDIVEKEMYSFVTRGDDQVTLRPEGTAGVVRAYAENKLYGEPDIAKLYYIGPMFRYERPQAGRYRQFHQFGIEAFGSTDPGIDAEVIALGYAFYRELGLRDVTVEINSVGTPEVRAAYRAQLQDFLRPMLGELCKDCQSRFDRNPLRILDCKVDQHRFEGAPSILDALDEECSTHFAKVREHLTAMDIPFRINPRLVRGLDYYTHTAFEYKAAGIGAIDTIGGGGRYNGLVGQVGGPDQPGVGLGLGLERVLLVLAAQGVELPAEKPLDVYLIGLGEAADSALARIAYDLRGAGLLVDKDYTGRKMKAQMKSADRFRAKFVAILGDDELAQGTITVKTMATGEQTPVPLSGLAEYLKTH
ncbi:histidine--tRNA ligase [Paenibacillus chartarius]|uniref:Histidine--tRNA ligase n=1 Tax=Paenibacillus chartarius TaxID=747481 RepID=A0ABV6DIS8_9BACL